MVAVESERKKVVEIEGERNSCWDWKWEINSCRERRWGGDCSSWKAEGERSERASHNNSDIESESELDDEIEWNGQRVRMWAEWDRDL